MRLEEKYIAEAKALSSYEHEILQKVIEKPEGYDLTLTQYTDFSKKGLILLKDGPRYVMASTGTVTTSKIAAPTAKR